MRVLSRDEAALTEHCAGARYGPPVLPANQTQMCDFCAGHLSPSLATVLREQLAEPLVACWETTLQGRTEAPSTTQSLSS